MLAKSQERQTKMRIIKRKPISKKHFAEDTDVFFMPDRITFKPRKKMFRKRQFSISQNEEYSLLGMDENAFNIIAYVTECLKKEKLDVLVVPFQQKAINGGHDNLMTMAQRYLDMANNAARKRIAHK